MSIQDKLEGLSEEEKKYVLSVLRDMDSGNSKSFTDLMYEDYNEIPVDIETFITDDNYMGQAWKDAEGKLKLYPFWLDKLKELFPNNTDVSVNNFIESGARGLGKSENAILTGQYLMYRVLCMKNPLEFFHMKPTEKICFAFMNITKELSEEIGVDKFQKSIQKSPWFMSKGRMTTYKNEPYWIPPEPIDVIIGSQASHVIGQPIFWCLSGDTVIKTTDGDRRLDGLVGKDIKVISVSDNGDLIESDTCTVLPTKLSKDEYEIELEDGSILHCTPEHRFMLIDGTYKQAKDLSLDDELMDFKPYGTEKLSLESEKIKINRISKITNESPVQFYDVVNANPYNNFLIKTDTGYVVSHNCFFDEISFIRNMDIDRQKQIAINMIDTAIGGMKTRFIHKGKNPTLLVLASSKRSEKSFLEEHMKKKLESEKENVLIVDEPVWNVKPKGTYSEKTFRVALGNKFLMSKVLQDDEDDMPYLRQGYKIFDVPIDFRADFLDDIDRALCDFAGISSSELSKYISGQAVNDCINNNRQNPFAKDVLEIGNAPDDRLQYYNFFDIDKIPAEWRSKPLYIHLDMSISGDKTGIAGVFAIGKKYSDNPNEQSKDMFYGLGFSVSIKAPKGRQVSFEKNRKFIYWLKEQGFNIQGISTDTFQSYDTGQQLLALGYPYKQISVDRVDTDHVCKPYQYLRSTIYEQRVDMYMCKLLVNELIDLERNINTGKVDHPNGGCFTDDTLIQLVDGRNVSIKDLLLEQSYKDNYVYTYNTETNKIEPKRIKSVHQTKIVSDLVRVTLDNGEVITCTPEHRFMLRDGSYAEIQSLSAGDSLMPLYTKVASKGLSGYRMYYEPYTDEWHYEHRYFCPNATRKKGTVIHHCNYNKLDNSPKNLKEMSVSDHITLHNNSTHDGEKVSNSLKKYFKSISGTEEELKRNENCRLGTIESYKRRGIYRQDDIVNRHKEIEKMSGKKYEEMTASEKNCYSNKLTREKDSSVLSRISSTLSERHREGKFENAYKALSQLVWYTDGVSNIYQNRDLDPPEGFHRGRTISKDWLEKRAKTMNEKSEEEKIRLKKILSADTSSRMWITDGNVDKYINKNDSIPDGFRRGRTKVGKNHKIVSIERIHRPCKVYDLTIEDNPNFALAAGVFVHNSKDMADAVCGAVFNASQSAEQFAYDYGEMYDVASEVSSAAASQEAVKQQIVVDFEEELKKLSGVFQPKKDNNYSLYKDFGFGPSKEVASQNDFIFL